jgi:tetratricopeptide (TPR) repeat protein
LHNRGDLDAAIKSYKEALKIKPDYAEAYINIGNVLKDKGDLDAAIESYKRAIVIKSDYAEAHYNMGVALKEKGETDAAIESYEQAIMIKPDYAEAYYNMSNALKSKGDLDAAIESYKRAIVIKSDYAEAYYNMGLSLQDKGDLDAAIESYKLAIQIKPDYAEAHINMGLALQHKGNLDESIESYKQAIKIKPDYADAHSNMGLVLQDKGDLDAVLESYEKALKIKPDSADAYYNKSLTHLLLEEFEIGWSQYEWRWKKTSFGSTSLVTTRPRWTPSGVGKLLLWSEQGLGDVTMFSSIIPELYKVSSQLIVQADKRLIPLFRRSFPGDIEFRSGTEVVSEADYDAQIPIGSLPQYFRPNLQSFEVASKGYLFPDQEMAASIRSNILQDGSEVLIGISWNSSSNLKGAQKRTIALGTMVKALAKPNIKLVSLQYGNVDKEIADVKKDLGIEIIQVQGINNREDIDDLTALMGACDKIVTIDNATVHLAGAIGKETTMLLPYSCSWRWGRKRRKSYWYDSVRLYQQTEIGDWERVLEKL